MSYSSSSYTGYSRFIFLLMGVIFVVVGLVLIAIGLVVALVGTILVTRTRAISELAAGAGGGGRAGWVGRRLTAAVETLERTTAQIRVRADFALVAAAVWLASLLGLEAILAAFTAGGLYQLTPLKARCLRRCRTPVAQLLHYGNYHGRLRDLRVGVHHGAYCLGCCWALMVVLVAAGAMGLVWVLLIAGAVALEKLAPRWLASPGVCTPRPSACATRAGGARGSRTGSIRRCAGGWSGSAAVRIASSRLQRRVRRPLG